MWDAALNSLVISHDNPDDTGSFQVLSGRRLTLGTFVEWLNQQVSYSGQLWLDVKNLHWSNAGEVGEALDRIFVTNQRRGMVYVESRNPLPLPALRSRGYRVIYWVQPMFSRRGIVDAKRQICLVGGDCVRAVWVMTKRMIGYALQKSALGYAGLARVSMPYDQYHWVEEEYRGREVFLWTNKLDHRPLAEQRRIIGELAAKDRIGVILVDDLRLLEISLLPESQ